MFSFFNFKKKVTVDCFTTDVFAYENVPIVKSSKTIPEWWKKLPKSKIVDNYPASTMKNCVGFKEFYKRGCVLESWCNLHVEVDDNGYRYYINDDVFPEEHPSSQYAGGFENFFHMKLISPWSFIEKNGYSFVFVGAEWSLEEKIKILPGICDFKYNNTTNINMMIPKMQYTFDIPIGNPLIHIIPLRDDINFDYKIHLITKEELKRVIQGNGIGRSGIVNGYRKFVKLKKRNEERKNSKCPFH